MRLGTWTQRHISKIQYKKNTGADLNIMHAYCDASDGDMDESKSQTGFVIYLNGAPVHWGSCKQTTTSLSTGESETKATCLVARELVFLRGLMAEMGHPQPPTEVFSDSEVSIAWNQPKKALSKRNKHLARQDWYCKEQVELGAIKLTHCSSADQIADIATKNLPRVTHEKLCKHLFDMSNDENKDSIETTD